MDFADERAGGLAVREEIECIGRSRHREGMRDQLVDLLLDPWITKRS